MCFGTLTYQSFRIIGLTLEQQYEPLGLRSHAADSAPVYPTPWWQPNHMWICSCNSTRTVFPSRFHPRRVWCRCPWHRKRVPVFSWLPARWVLFPKPSCHLWSLSNRRCTFLASSDTCAASTAGSQSVHVRPILRYALIGHRCSRLGCFVRRYPATHSSRVCDSIGCSHDHR